MTRSVWMAVGAAALVAVTAAACGSSPTTPTPPAAPPSSGGGGGGGNPLTATITIGANGSVSPASVTIAPGGRVTFVNSHSQAHDMSSDPHPEHTQCPEINQVGFLTAGQSRTTGNLNTVRTCGFHDHNQPDTAGLKGTIIIQ